MALTAAKNVLIGDQPTTLTINSTTFKDVVSFDITSSGTTHRNRTDGQIVGMDGGIETVDFSAVAVVKDFTAIDLFYGGLAITTLSIVYPGKGDATAGATLTFGLASGCTGRVTSVSEGTDGRRKTYSIAMEIFSSSTDTNPPFTVVPSV